MHEVALRQIPERSALCLLRHVADEAAVTALGKEFIAMIRDQQLPWLEGQDGAAFLIYHGQVSADSDRPVEWCQPVPAGQAAELAARFPQLTLRTEPAHDEAYVKLGPAQMSALQWQQLTDALYAWVSEQQRTASGLGFRLTFRITQPVTAQSRPDVDFAVPLS